MDPILGMIFLFGGNFAPSGYALCNGATLAISPNTALFSLLGTMYGGNGTTTFSLPDLQGRTPIGFGQGTTASNYVQGVHAGVENITLTTNNIPPHNHLFNASDRPGNTNLPTNGILSAAPSTGSGPNAVALNMYQNSTALADTTLGSTAISLTGGGQAFSVLQPYLVICYVIALQGIYPSRN